MSGLLIILGSFILAIVVRKLAMMKNECMMAQFLPQLIMLVGGLYGGYIFISHNWSL